MRCARSTARARPAAAPRANDQYVEITADFRHYIDDPHVDPVRKAVTADRLRIVDIVPEVAVISTYWSLASGAAPVALVAVLLAQRIGIEVEGLAHGPLPFSARAEPCRDKLKSTYRNNAKFASPSSARNKPREICLPRFHAASALTLDQSRM